MCGASTQKKKSRIELAQDYKIFFENDINRSKWPACRKEMFDDIVKLGQTSSSTFVEDVSIHSSAKPWERERLRRAEGLASMARRCIAENRNEDGWRHGVENIILHRFSIEVQCKSCRKRLWISEKRPKNAEPETNFERQDTLRRIEARRAVVCVCHPDSERKETGLNIVFSDRVSEQIIHEAEITKAIGKIERPDRIYGLRETKKFNDLLNAPDKRGRIQGYFDKVGYNIKSCPFPENIGDRLLFPFLVLEAKSGRSGFGIRDIELQTQFSIRTLLKLQDALQSKARDHATSIDDPLVWFLSYKGESWRISAAFTQQRGLETQYVILPLWCGLINVESGALQLLHIIDYICEWARESYRETIILGLEALVAQEVLCELPAHRSDTMSQTPDVWQRDEQFPDAEPLKEDKLGIPQALLDLDSESGAIRHAKFIQRRFIGLYITEDNLDTLLQSMHTPEAAVTFCSGVMSSMTDCWKVSGDALARFEFCWTGHDQLSDAGEFYVKFIISAYFTTLWQQVVELSYIAVSPGALRSLAKTAGLPLQDDEKASETETGATNFNAAITVEDAVLEDFVKRFDEPTVEENFWAAICRVSIVSTTTRYTTLHGFRPSMMIKEQGNQILTFRDVQYLRERGLVAEVYASTKIGRREPSESFLRISHQRVIQAPKRYPSLLWPFSPFRNDGNRLNCNRGLALVYCQNAEVLGQATRQCLFIVRGFVEISDVEGLLNDAFGGRCIHETKWRDLGDGWDSLSSPLNQRLTDIANLRNNFDLDSWKTALRLKNAKKNALRNSNFYVPAPPIGKTLLHDLPDDSTSHGQTTPPTDELCYPSNLAAVCGDMPEYIREWREISKRGYHFKLESMRIAHKHFPRRPADESLNDEPAPKRQRRKDDGK